MMDRTNQQFVLFTVRERQRDLWARAENDRLARLLRGRRTLRNRLGRALIAVGRALADQPHDATPAIG